MNSSTTKLSADPTAVPSETRPTSGSLSSTKKSDIDRISLVEDTLENRILSFSAFVDSSSIDVDLIIDYLKNNNQIDVNEEIMKRKCDELAQSGFVELTFENRTKPFLKMSTKTKEMILKELRDLAKARKEEERILIYFDRITPWIHVDHNSRYSTCSPEDKKEWEELKALSSHLVEIVKIIQLENLNMANILSRIARYYEFILNDYKKAIEYEERSMRIRSKLCENDEIIWPSWDRIGHLYDLLGQHEQALHYLNVALEACERKKDFKKSADYLNAIGELYDKLGDYQKALDNKERSLQIRRRKREEERDDEKDLNDDNPDNEIVDSINSIGLTYFKSGDYRKALDYFDRSLASRERIYSSIDPNSPEIAESLNNLGETYEKLGDYQKALDYFERSLQIYKEHFDIDSSSTDHPKILSLQQRIIELMKLVHESNKN